jgi:hypothetical protein
MMNGAFETTCRFCGKPIFVATSDGIKWRAVDLVGGAELDHKPACLESQRKAELEASR